MFASQGVGTQGADRDNWVTMYTLEWSEEGESWEPYQEDGYEMVPWFYKLLIFLFNLFSLSVLRPVNRSVS